MACGKGRHSVHLNSLGYQVTGLDLSEESIAYAKQFENSSLHFDVHDMSTPYHDQFDAVFNLFTSFGYFENEEDNLKGTPSTWPSVPDNLSDNFPPSDTNYGGLCSDALLGLCFSMDFISEGQKMKQKRPRQKNKSNVTLNK